MVLVENFENKATISEEDSDDEELKSSEMESIIMSEMKNSEMSLESVSSLNNALDKIELTNGRI